MKRMDVITSLEKRYGKMHMGVNEERTVKVPLSLFRERPFEVGDAIDLEEYDNWLMVRQYRHALDRAGAYLSVRSRSTKELERLLLRAGYLESTVEMVILKLQKMKYLNDEVFAEQWVASRSNKALGKRRIAQELRMKGISKESAENALSNMDEEQLEEKVQELAAKLAHKYRNEEPRKAQDKLMQALVRRGFDWDESRSAAKKALASIQQDEQ